MVARKVVRGSLISRRLNFSKKKRRSDYMINRIWGKPLKTVLAAGLVANLLIPAIPLTTEAATNAAD